MKETFRKTQSSRPSKYFYKVEDTWHKHPYTRKECAVCGKSKMMKVCPPKAIYCSKACSKVGEANHMWKGDRAGYVSLHARVYRRRGKASAHTCPCGSPAEHWANQTGHYEDVNDYKPMCPTCHKLFDNSR